MTKIPLFSKVNRAAVHSFNLTLSTPPKMIIPNLIHIFYNLENPCRCRLNLKLNNTDTCSAPVSLLRHLKKKEQKTNNSISFKYFTYY